MRGAVSGATAGWAPQLSGVEAASGVPTSSGPAGAASEIVGGPAPHIARLGIGAARLAYEHLTGQRGPATEAYENASRALRERQEELQKQHPIVYGGGELAGAGATMVATPELEIPALVGKGVLRGAGRVALRGATAGVPYGTASGAHEGFEKEGLEGLPGGAAIGAAEGLVGGILGEGVGALVGKGVSKAYDAYGRPIARWLRGAEEGTEEDAAVRAAGALKTDEAANESSRAKGFQPKGLTGEEFAARKAAGDPVTLADMGGETTDALLRAAANADPAARAEIEGFLANRFRTQSERAGVTIRSLVGGDVNAMRSMAQAEAKYEAERIPAYRAAYEAGDKPIWSSELERLSASPDVEDALRGAIRRWKSFQVKDGYGAMDPPVKVTPDGQLQFLPGAGLMPYPNLQLWDYASRNLAGKAAEAARAGNKTDADLFGGLSQQLKAELDRLVPQFKDARGVAANYFGTERAKDAAEKALKDPNLTSTQILQVMGGMKPGEKEMFQEAYADAMARRYEGLGENRDVTNLYNNPRDQKKAEAVFGPEGAKKLQAFVAREKIYDFRRKAVQGNSTTVRQMIEQGLIQGFGQGLTGAGIGIGGELALGHRDVGDLVKGAGYGVVAARIATKGVGKGLEKVLAKVDRTTAVRVARLLTSDDPRELHRGLEIASRNKLVRDRLLAMGSRAAAALGAAERPGFVAPIGQAIHPVAAQDQQQGVPGPVQQQKAGGAVQQRDDGGPTGTQDEYSALGPVGKSGQALPPSPQPYQAPTPEQVGEGFLDALGPLGEAGRQVGDIARTGHMETRDVAPILGGVMMGTAGPKGEGLAREAAPGIASIIKRGEELFPSIANPTKKALSAAKFDIKSVYTPKEEYAQHRDTLVQGIKDDFIRQYVKAGGTENNARKALERSSPSNNDRGGLQKAWDTYSRRNDYLAAAEKGFQDLAQKVGDAHSRFIERFQKRNPQRARGGRVERVTKASVHFSHNGTENRRCGICTMFVAGKPPHCTAVKGPIKAGDICRLFKVKASERAAGGGVQDNYDDANADLEMTPQEQALYQRHLLNLYEPGGVPGGVPNPDGSISTLYQISHEQDGKTYNLPTVYEGKILSPDDAITRANKEGIDKFPSYATPKEAESRYQAMHDYMDRDAANYFAKRNKRAGGGAMIANAIKPAADKAAQAWLDKLKQAEADQFSWSKRNDRKADEQQDREEDDQ
jgi:hypothetical protein